MLADVERFRHDTARTLPAEYTRKRTKYGDGVEGNTMLTGEHLRDMSNMLSKGFSRRSRVTVSLRSSPQIICSPKVIVRGSQWVCEAVMRGISCDLNEEFGIPKLNTRANTRLSNLVKIVGCITKDVWRPVSRVYGRAVRRSGDLEHEARTSRLMFGVAVQGENLTIGQEEKLCEEVYSPGLHT